ncbi:Large exoproteins involved in heme utilization or adhesion [Burkholderia singularis]|uniref:Large exoproteins involved in heme utilization or adhesion n=1 Tax=Burkholderia singularis TaxID=1503053 RepID=A0A238H2I4_9BURK|nr:Large exoproteins involved in heme utilization or adhesion [Burkholderia singularis]
MSFYISSSRVPVPKTLSMLVALACSLAYTGTACAQSALPAGGAFVSGTGAIFGGGTSLTVNQSSARGVIDWRSFSIGSGRSVTINNGAGATLNRVTGGDPSVILGSLKATGSVYLLNPQGVLIGPGGVVSTGGRFVASALNIDKDAFMQGAPLTLSGAGNGAIVNLGQISSTGGDVLLVSRTQVSNQGSINAPKGTAELAAGQQVLLQDSATGPQVFVQAGSGGSVLNAGTIRAAQANLQAADGNIYALAGNNAAIRATGTAVRDGHVWLVADQGSVQAHGVISAANANGAGAVVETRGQSLNVSGATVQAGQWTLGAPAFTLDGANASTVADNLSAGTPVTVEANGANGDLTVGSSVRWNGNAPLTLSAAHSVAIAPNTIIGNTGGANLTLRADAGGVNNGGSVVNGGTIDWSSSTGLVNAFYDMNGQYSAGTILTNSGWSAAPFSGLVTQATAYKLVNTLTDLQNVSHDLTANYALGRDIDASSTSGAAAFQPIGAGSDAPFAGQFDGFGHLINHLTVNAPAGATQNTYVGLFGLVGATGVIRNVVLTDEIVSGAHGTLGAIAGRNDGQIANASIAGYNSRIGPIAQDPATGGWTTAEFAGGLVGINNGTIDRSSTYQTSVSAYQMAGGLAAVNNGTIRQSVAWSTSAGSLPPCCSAGLVGINNGLIAQSYATGSALSGGGLVFQNNASGVIDQSYANVQIASRGIGMGGNVAYSNTGVIANNVYWNAQMSGLTYGMPAVTSGSGAQPPLANGLNNAQMAQSSNFASWNFGPNGTWAMPAGATSPMLAWQLNSQAWKTGSH